MKEHHFQCPYCWEQISMLLDPSVSTSYIEDCEVCCNPIRVTTQFDTMRLKDFAAKPIEQ